MSKLKMLLLLVLLFTLSGPSVSNSLWSENSTSPYSVQRNYKIGDIINVLVVESTSAVQKSGTDTQNQDNLSVNLTHTIERLNGVIGPSNSVQGSGSNVFKGLGSTTRTSNVLAIIAVTVKKVLPNKNLFISGTHKVSVNDEVQEISIEGSVRPNDITGYNTVYSYQVADSTVAVKGQGTVGEASSPGLFIRFLNWLF